MDELHSIFDFVNYGYLGDQVGLKCRNRLKMSKRRCDESLL